MEVASFSPYLIPQDSAWHGHLPFAAWMTKTLKPKIFVELGTHWGHSYFAFCQAVKEAHLNISCHAIDTWAGDEHAAFYGEEVFSHVNSHNETNYSDFSRLHRETFDDALRWFEDSSIDLLHIDGLHTYEAVKHDFESWLPKLAPGAIVLFHDTQVRDRGFGVHELWEELRVKYPRNMEFKHSFGLGVLQIGENNCENLNSLFGENKQSLINFFEKLGQLQIQRYQLNQANFSIKNLSASLAQQEEQNKNLSASLAQQEEQNKNLSAFLAQQEERVYEATSIVEAIKKSNSWKITAPLRMIGSVARSATMFTGTAARKIKKLPAKVSALIKIFKRDGVFGVQIYLRGCIAERKWLWSGSGLDSAQLQIRSTDYLRWFGLYAAMNPYRINAIKERIDKLERKPLISVIMPTYNANYKWLKEAIDSVRKQLYQNWELCIADDASTDNEIRKFLQNYASLDSRIKVVLREENGHISAATNSAINISSGSWIAFLDHDDLITEDALFWIAKAINDNDEARLIYSDEDKIDSGHISSPYFKCEFNRDLLYSQNYICHLSAFDRGLINEVGQLREGYEGAQDYDLVLRSIEKLGNNQIVHIPRVLYHWRMHNSSTALSVDNKGYAVDAGVRALRDHFARLSITASVVSDIEGMYRVEYLLPKIMPTVTIIIPTKDKKLLLEKCIESIINKTSYNNYNIIIIDNNSTEKDAIDYINSLNNNNIKIIFDKSEFNYSALNNKAVDIADGDYICLLNNDIEVITPGWLEELVGIASQDAVGAVGARLWYPNNTLQHGGVITGLGGIAGHAHKYFPKGDPGYFRRAEVIQQLSAVTGACIVIKKTKYLEVGGLNQTDLRVAFNDVDLCLRLDAMGYRNIWTPYAELYHHESISRGADNTPEKQNRFRGEIDYMNLKWGNRLLNDPFYSPNLTICHEDFSYAWPPRVEYIE